MNTTIQAIDSKDTIEQTYAEDDASFWEMLSKPAAGAEQKYDFYAGDSLSFLKSEVEVRSGLTEAISPYGVVSARFTVQQAAKRYFVLMARARDSMSNMFTEDEILRLLNSAMSPVSELRPCSNMATTVADDLNIENLDELAEDSPTRLLMNKLLSLTFIQDAALMELTELFWRRDSHRSISDFGLDLSSETSSQ